MDTRFRGWMCNLLARRRPLLAIAIRQRAKFEHWLKFELAEEAAAQGASDIQIEPTPESVGQSVRSDLAFIFDGAHYHIELKTPNTNWRMPGVLQLTRPITNNIASIIGDARKPPLSQGQRIVAFTLFPIPPGDSRWHVYLKRISDEVGIHLSEQQNASRVDIPLTPPALAQVVVVTFIAPSRTSPAKPPTTSLHAGSRT